MKKYFTSKEIFTIDNYEDPFKNQHRSLKYNLEEHFGSLFSQHGEDGVIHHLFSKIPKRKKYYVEFGAGNGRGIENTRYLREYLQGDSQWSGLLMDGNIDLVNQSNGLVNHEWITSDNIMNLFSKYDVPEDFDLLSIDIDGDDIYVFDAINTGKYKPSIIIAEYNPGLPNHIPLAIEEGKSHFGINFKESENQKFADYHGANIHAWYVVAKRKKYSILTTCGVNVIMVRNTYAKNFEIPSLSNLVYEPYFAKQLHRFHIQKELSDDYKWVLID